MLPVKLHLKNIGPYEDETIDFQGVPGNVIAIVGENGAGKTMLVDSIFAALYRYFPSRDSIYKYCRGKNATIEFEFYVGGRRHRTEIKINAVKREMESWLFRSSSDGTQNAALTDGKNSTFDKAVKDLLGPAEQVLASVYSAQNKAGSFISLPKAKRKELFIEMLGLSKLQAVSDEAGNRERAVKIEYDKLAVKVDTMRVATAKKDLDLDPLYKQLAAIRDEVGVTETDIKLGLHEVEQLRSKAKAVTELSAREFPLTKRRLGLERDMKETAQAILHAESCATSLSTFRDLAGRADSIESELQRLRTEAWHLSDQRDEWRKRMDQYVQELHALEKERDDHKKWSEILGLKMARAGSDAALVSTVPCKAEGECANCQFLVDAVMAREAIPSMETELDNNTAAGLAVEYKIKSLPQPERKQLEEIEAIQSNLIERIGALETQAQAAQEAKVSLQAAQLAADALENLQIRQSRLKVDLDATIAEHAVLAAQIKEAAASQDQLRKAETQLAYHTQVLETEKQRLNVMLGEVSKAEAEKGLASKAQAELDALLPDLVKLDTDRRQWALLSKAFGKTGIQSLEIDAAGPTVSEIVNDLLFSCFGPRFSVRFVTQVLKDDKSGYKDDFDIYVTDAESEREGSIDDLSGGEKVIISEGLSLAIALFNQGRSQINWGSLFRDEASSAVDDRRAPLYIQMLRRAREQGHFEKLFFIAHQQRVTEGADAKMLVSSGKITFE
jgi:exonuclease SbcC